jgi:hypothetical protein
MKRLIIAIYLLNQMGLLFMSCTTINKSMREPNTLLELKKEDFILSEQKNSSASATQIFGIDFSRLFTKKTGTVKNSGAEGISSFSIPIIGNYLSNKTSAYSLYNLMKENPGYDVVLYPQFDTKVVRPFLGLGFIIRKTDVNVTSRLGKFKN